MSTIWMPNLFFWTIIIMKYFSTIFEFHLGSKHKVCHLHKDLYNLHQFPCIWNKQINTYFQSSGLMPCFSNHSLYVLIVGEILILIIHGDKMMIVKTYV